MQPTRRRPPPPWERGAPAPRHPTGRTHRRFPAADRAEGVPARLPQRYRSAYDGAGDTRVNEGVRLRRCKAEFSTMYADALATWPSTALPQLSARGWIDAAAVAVMRRRAAHRCYRMHGTASKPSTHPARKFCSCTTKATC